MDFTNENSVLFIYCIYDKVAKSYGRLDLFSSDGVALRYYNDVFSDDKMYYKAHRSDFMVFKIGLFNPFTAEIVSEKFGCIMDGDKAGQAINGETEVL